jgi:hypothetical protein
MTLLLRQLIKLDVSTMLSPFLDDLPLQQWLLQEVVRGHQHRELSKISDSLECVLIEFMKIALAEMLRFTCIGKLMMSL